MRRKKKVNCVWSAEFAYVIGILASDGNLSPDGRHINITSKDREVVEMVRNILKLENKIGRKGSGQSLKKKYFVLQFGDINFYEFLLSIGLTPAKSKILEEVHVPDRFFIDFFRGCIDGDGNIGVHTHPESTKIQIKLRLSSASPLFAKWVLNKTRQLYKIRGGYIFSQKRTSMHTVTYGKKDALTLLRLMYYAVTVPALIRKQRQAEVLIDR